MMLLPKVGLLAETLIWSSAKRQTGAAALSVIVMTFAPLRCAISTDSVTSTA